MAPFLSQILFYAAIDSSVNDLRREAKPPIPSIAEPNNQTAAGIGV